MYRIRPILILPAVLAACLLPGATTGQPKDEKKYAAMPWHLVETWWDTGEARPFETGPLSPPVPS